MINFREWLAKNKHLAEMGNMPVTDPGMQLQQLQQQMNDPATPPAAKQQIQAQIQALQKGTPQPMQNNKPGNPAGGTPGNNAFNHAPQTSTAYKWVNGRPVPVNMNQV